MVSSHGPNATAKAGFAGASVVLRRDTLVDAVKEDNPGVTAGVVAGVVAEILRIVRGVATLPAFDDASNPQVRCQALLSHLREPGLRRPSSGSVFHLRGGRIEGPARDVVVELSGDGLVADVPEATVLGTGLGQILSEQEAAARLEAVAQPSDIESWGGPMLRPSAMARRLDVSRSTLDSWRQAGLVVAVPRGRVAHLYPVAQFPEMRPLPGVGEVLEAADGNGALAWRWLTTPHAAFAGATPLARLIGDRAGGAGAVAAVARDDLA